MGGRRHERAREARSRRWACVLATWAIACATGCAAAAPEAARAEPAAKPPRAVTPQTAAGRERAPSAADRATLPAAASGSPDGRFFLAGDGEIAIANAHSGEKLRVRYRDREGRYDPAGLARIDQLFRSRGDDERTRVALRLVEVIDYLEDRERPSRLLLLSGYRSGEYNAAVIARGGKAAQASMHTEGLAADLRFDGIDQRELWSRIRALDCCGAGFYEKSGFLHVDVGRPRFWEQGTSRVGENLSRGNARVIARTDYDRYRTLDGAAVSLHAVTLRPLRVARAARFVPDAPGAALDAPAEAETAGAASAAGATVAAAPSAAGTASGAFALDVHSAAAGPASDAACLDFAAAADPQKIVLEVAASAVPGTDAPPAAVRGRIALRTCEPRLEATPAEILTNPIEIGAPVS